MATVNTLGGHHSCTLLVSARWRIPEASTEEETVKARAADGYMWELPEQTPLRAMLPYLPWQHADGQPVLLSAVEMEPVLAMASRTATANSPSEIRFLTHMLAPAAMRVLVALLDSGFTTVPPVQSPADWLRRLGEHFKAHPFDHRFELGADDHSKNQAAFGSIPPTLKWMAQVDNGMLAAAYP
jgi:hypothetical protein